MVVPRLLKRTRFAGLGWCELVELYVLAEIQLLVGVVIATWVSRYYWYMALCKVSQKRHKIQVEFKRVSPHNPPYPDFDESILMPSRPIGPSFVCSKCRALGFLGIVLLFILSEEPLMSCNHLSWLYPLLTFYGYYRVILDIFVTISTSHK